MDSTEWFGSLERVENFRNKENRNKLNETLLCEK